MNWLFPWWWSAFKAPLSGDVSDISPETNWFSPQVEVNVAAGNRKVEAEVVSRVASYGKQLGMVIDALLEIAGENEGPAVSALHDLAEQIEEVKEKHKAVLEDVAVDALNRLKTTDPETFKRVIQSVME
jgi:hypothetical protein